MRCPCCYQAMSKLIIVKSMVDFRRQGSFSCTVIGLHMHGWFRSLNFKLRTMVTEFFTLDRYLTSFVCLLQSVYNRNVISENVGSANDKGKRWF
jgi:hypothetical protein